MRIKLIKFFYGLPFFLLTLLIFVWGLFHKKRSLPTNFVFSLSQAQVYENSTPDGILRFFQQKRFKDLGLSPEILFEVRGLKTFLSRRNAFTFDFNYYLITKVICRKSYSRLLNSILSSIIEQDFSVLFSPKKYRNQILVPIIWTHIFNVVDCEITLITSQSSLLNLPTEFLLPSKIRIRRIMIWYSTNSKPIKKIHDEFSLPSYLGKIKELEHWVWNNFEVSYLRNLGVKSVKSIGSVVFQDEALKEKSKNFFVITFFDVTPMLQACDYYSSKIALNNLNEFFEVTKKLQCEFGEFLKVRIKPKRKYSKIHSQVYLDRIQDGIDLGLVVLLSPNINLYSAISESDLVLSIPFTSSSVIARELDIPTFYCSFDSSEWEIPNNSSGISVIKSQQKLFDEIRALIIDKFPLPKSPINR